jgi:hypothetical protein
MKGAAMTKRDRQDFRKGGLGRQLLNDDWCTSGWILRVLNFITDSHSHTLLRFRQVVYLSFGSGFHLFVLIGFHIITTTHFALI